MSDEEMGMANRKGDHPNNWPLALKTEGGSDRDLTSELPGCSKRRKRPEDAAGIQTHGRSVTIRADDRAIEIEASAVTILKTGSLTAGLQSNRAALGFDTLEGAFSALALRRKQSREPRAKKAASA